MQSLDGMGADAQDAIINYLAEVNVNMSPFDPVVLRATNPDEWSGAVLGYDDHSATAVKSMIEDIVAITESYGLSDEQWQDTISELSAVDATGQRAFLEITRTGLETLVGSDDNHKIDVADNKAVHDVLEQLRGSQTVRELVSKSRMGEEKVSDGRSYHAYKDAADSERDQQAVIETVVADAWLHKDVEGRGIHFALKIASLDEAQRDEQIAAIHSLLETEEPLSALTVDELKENLKSFEQRTDAVVNSHDIVALSTLEQSLEPEEQQQFWSVSEVLQDSVDELVETLEPLEKPKQAMVLEYLNTLIEEQQKQQEQKAEDPLDSKQLKSMNLDFLEQISKGTEVP